MNVFCWLLLEFIFFTWKKSNIPLIILTQTEAFFTHSFFYYEFLNFVQFYDIQIFSTVKTIITSSLSNIDNHKNWLKSCRNRCILSKHRNLFYFNNYYKCWVIFFNKLILNILKIASLTGDIFHWQNCPCLIEIPKRHYYLEHKTKN